MGSRSERFVKLGVGVDLLDIVEVFKSVDQFLHCKRIVTGEGRRVLRAHRHLGDGRFESGLFEPGADRGKVAGGTDHLKAAFFVRHDIFRSSLERGFHDPIFGCAGSKQKLPAVLEHEGDRSVGTENARPGLEVR